MNRLATALSNVAKTLEVLELRWALVGGVAVSARSEPRFTRDVDIVVIVEDDVHAEQMVQALMGRGYQVLAIVEQEQTARLATVRLLPQHETEQGVVIDLLFASSGIEQEVAYMADALEIFPNVRVPVARSGHLLALKILSRDDKTRPQDIVDIRSLLEVSNAEEIALAEQSIKLITTRNFHRGRDLLAEFRNLIQT